MKNALIIFSLMLSANLFSQKLNRFDRHGERRGRWIVYMDSAKQIKSSNVRFRKGNAVGRGYYYAMDGTLGRMELVRFKKIKTVFYYPSGNKRLTGIAKLENRTDTAHYYFYGRWKYYDELGKLLKYGYFEKGKLVSTEYLDKTTQSNDSLINTLRRIEKIFLVKNDSLIKLTDKYTTNQIKAETFREDIARQYSVSFKEVMNYLGKNRYPSVKTMGETASVPFYIICYSPAKLRQACLETFENAVLSGDLSSKTLAYFVDKLNLSMGKKQVYGTQYYRDKNRNLVYYPSADPENLEKRRVEVGLD